jgi:hypothetical protein
MLVSETVVVVVGIIKNNRQYGKNADYIAGSICSYHCAVNK